MTGPISLALTALLAVAALLPLLPAKTWWVRGLDFPRLPVAALAAVLALMQLAVPGWGGPGLAAVTTALFLHQAWWVWPYTPLGSREVRPAADSDRGQDRTSVRVMAANVLQGNRRAADLVALVREARPDLLLLVETDAWWIDQLAGLEPAFPHRIRQPLDNLYGMALFSRWPLKDARVQFLVEDDKPSIHTLVRLPDGRCLRFVGVHPAPPSPTENDTSAERDAELLLVGRSVAGDERPVIVAGDLNDVAWSHTTRRFHRLSGLLDPRRGRGMFSTYPAAVPRWLRWPMDHLFHSRHFRLGALHILAPFGSDHLAVLGELWLEPAAGLAQTPVTADADDREEAAEETAEAGVRPGDVHVPEAAASDVRG